MNEATRYIFPPAGRQNLRDTYYGPVQSDEGNWVLWQDYDALRQASAAAGAEIGRLKAEADNDNTIIEKQDAALKDMIWERDDLLKQKQKADIERINITAALQEAQGRVGELEVRLEVDPRTPWDGIACRDETIRLQDEALARYKSALQTIAAQSSGIPGSTNKADCMAAIASVALRAHPAPEEGRDGPNQSH